MRGGQLLGNAALSMPMLAASLPRRSSDLSSAPRPTSLQKSGSGASASLQTMPAMAQLSAGFPIETDSPIPSSLDFGYSRELSNRYTVGELLGTGGNAVVRKVTDKRTGTELACKSLPKELKVQLHMKDCAALDDWWLCTSAEQHACCAQPALILGVA